MPLDVNAARAAVGRLAGSLGLGLEETAAGIVNVNNLHAATAIRQQTLERGLDPRDFVLYSYGGAGPVHAFGYAGEIGIREVVIPLGNGASTLSAYGIAAGDVARFAEMETAQRAPFDDMALSSAVAGLVKLARQAMADAGVTQEPHVDVWALMRYTEQLMHALEVPVDPAGSDGAGLSRRFTQEYARRYGESAASAFQAAEIFTLRARARVPAAARWAGDDGAASAADQASRTAEVYWPDAGTRLATVVHDGGRLSHGDEITGPVPQDLDAMPGEEQPVDHKGPLLMMGPDSVLAWTGANNPGYGDPLVRSPQAVAGDVSRGWLGPADATRVYAVAWDDDGAVDETGTRRLRAERLAARLAAARPPADGAAWRRAGPDAELRPVGGDLGVLLTGGHPAEWVSLSGRALLGPVTGDYRAACAVLDTPGQSLALGTLREWAGTQLADYKLPAELVILSALPRNASGKVIKKQLAAQLAAQLAGTRSPSAPART